MKQEGNKKSGDQGSRGLRIKDVIDSLAKIIGAAAILFAIYIAHNYESKQAAFTLLSQRKQAESQLRTSMFSDLIEPIIGRQTGGNISVEREQLLVELLTLNFHEHFNFKPLLLHVEQSLLSKKKEGLSPEDIQKRLYSLRSVAHRVVTSQIALLIKDGAPDPTILVVDEPDENATETAKNVSGHEENAPHAESIKPKYLIEALEKAGINEKKIKEILESIKQKQNLIEALKKAGINEKKIKKILESIEQKQNLIEALEKAGINEKEITGINNEVELYKKFSEKGIKPGWKKHLITLWREAYPDKPISQIPGEKYINIRFRQTKNGKYDSPKVSLLPPSGRKDVRDSDGKFAVDLAISNPDWENRTVRVSLVIKRVLKDSCCGTVKIDKEFTLTWYDMPFVDNTLLSDGYRFSVVLSNMDTETMPRAVHLQFIWFPQNYFPPRERPVNNSYFQEYIK